MIALVIVRLLSLTTNQLSRLKRASHTYDFVKNVHLEETPEKLVLSSLLPTMQQSMGDSSETLLLFCFPQYLADTGVFRNALLQCHHRRTL